MRQPASRTVAARLRRDAGAAAAGRFGGIASAVALIAVVTVIAGCATSNADTSGATAQTGATASLASGPIAAGKARVTISRPSSIVYAAAPATITLNGAKVADVAAGSSAVVDIPAGANTLAASAWPYPGASTLKLSVKAGETIALEVTPRDASVGAGMLLGPLGGLVDGSTPESGSAFDIRRR